MVSTRLESFSVMLPLHPGLGSNIATGALLAVSRISTSAHVALYYNYSFAEIIVRSFQLCPIYFVHNPHLNTAHVCVAEPNWWQVISAAPTLQWLHGARPLLLLSLRIRVHSPPPPTECHRGQCWPVHCTQTGSWAQPGTTVVLRKVALTIPESSLCLR